MSKTNYRGNSCDLKNTLHFDTKQQEPRTAIGQYKNVCNSKKATPESCLSQALRDGFWRNKKGRPLEQLLPKAELSLAHRHVATVADDEMVEALHVEQLPGLHDRPRHHHVVGAWLGVGRGVVVRHNN
jgi:hypothetical protein